jgi:hypothetical protein
MIHEGMAQFLWLQARYVIPNGSGQLCIRGEKSRLTPISHHMPQGTLSCYAIHLEGHKGHEGFQI